MDATFVRKYYGSRYTHNEEYVYLDYSYRGHEYTVIENRAKGNAPLSWQHRSEQYRIDRLIEQEERDKNAEHEPYSYEHSADYAIDQLWRYWEGARGSQPFGSSYDVDF